MSVALVVAVCEVHVPGLATCAAGTVLPVNDPLVVACPQGFVEHTPAVAVRKRKV